MYIIYLVLIILVLILALWQISNLISIAAGSLFVKTETDLIDLALQKAGLKKNDVFYDLGCGSGEVIEAAAKFGARATGFEVSPFYFLLAKIKTRNSKAQVRFLNIKNVDLSCADIVYCYLLPKFLDKLKNKFILEQPKKIISIGFAIKGLPKAKIYHSDKHKIFIYSLRSRSV